MNCEKSLILEGEELPKIHHVTKKHLLAIFDESDADFGQFLVLSNEQSGFIQSANLWELSKECEQFQDRTQSEPYSLEYKDEATGHLYAAEGWFALWEIKDAFVDYLRGSMRWKHNKVWNKIDY
jgi:hypothetical protein